MNYHTYFSSPARVEPVQTCIVGTGGFGRSFLAQGRRVPLMHTRVAVDVSAEIAAASMRSAGIAEADIRICNSTTEARAAWDAGTYIAAGQLETVLDLPLDVVVEATGHPEAGARHVRLAVEAGHHVALVSKEVDSVVGPELARLARSRGRFVSPVDGDQPSLLIGLVTWAEVIGLDIVAAGKSSEYDFIFDPAAGRLTSNGRTVDAPGFADWLTLGDRDCAEVAAGRAAAAAELPQRAVPDLCEMTVVANATGLMPDRPDLHAPIAAIGEVADFFATRKDGGLLDGTRRLDVFHCLRLPNEVSFAGGVFVVVNCDDESTWTMLREKGHVLSRSGRTAMLHIPRHLLGLEAATTVLEMALRGVSSGAQDPRHHVDLVAHADADLPAGTVLTMGGHHHAIDNVSSRMVPAGALGADSPVPFYLAAGARLTRPVTKNTPIRLGDLEIDPNSELSVLRRQQDEAFFPGQ
ncbi:flagellar biosynthesis protein FlgA [Devosia sp. PTR5]|uniref:Flagellar biosynthesis protein FlgA n=1 Tax=Devosia oryzisoli TaxID=2774138 RepID=A0A927FTS7_9HYPH|nr:SAF domain-containing protein [Devosia oryzisoli]MBD8066145.1 flagellar biosynthesis protein FlgA [Devosia oryzisoli]